MRIHFREHKVRGTRMTENGGNGWFSLIAAMPSPENGERVNVGLAIHDGKRLSVLYDSDLPRLAGLLSAPDRHGFAMLLEAIARLAAEGKGLDEIREGFSPQIAFAEPRALLMPPTSKVIESLRKHYIQGPGSTVGTYSSPLCGVGF